MLNFFYKNSNVSYIECYRCKKKIMLGKDIYMGFNHHFCSKECRRCYLKQNII